MKVLRGLVNNLVIKVISLILAVLTWGYITGQLYRESTEKEKEVSSIIEVSGEKLIVKRLPIYVNIEGAPAKHYEVALDKIRVNPSYSVVAGPTNVIRDLSYILTESIAINGASNNVRKSVKLTQIPKCTMGYEGLVSVTVPIIRQRHK